LKGHSHLSMQMDYFCKSPAPVAIASDIAASKYLVLGKRLSILFPTLLKGE
jgi:hypothetical protein